jgi:flagellar biosynthesis protein FliR
VGHAWEGQAAAGPMLRQVTGLFALGFALAAPVVLALLLVEFALGVVSRNLPQMNLLLLGLPVKIIVGLAALMIWAAGFAAPASRLYAGIYQAWAGWFASGATR